MDEDRVFSCANCGAEVTRAEASVRETIGDLDPDRWKTLCCPVCGARLETVFLEDG
jgi:DNA-directed RNA polymerase subunit RPC12/RpoP